NEDQYFFDSKAFAGIIDYYAEKYDPVKALHVTEFAISQHPFDITFLLTQAQLSSTIQQYRNALAALDKAELLEASEGDIFLIRGGILGSIGQFDEALDQLFKALPLLDNKDEVYFHVAMIFQAQMNYDKAIVYLKKALELNMDYQEA